MGGAAPEVQGDELAAAGATSQELLSLPLLEQKGYIIEGWSHLLAGYPRSGKTELQARMVGEWLRRGCQVVYLTEEPRPIWEHRLAGLPGDWSHVAVVFGLGIPPDALFRRAFTGSESIVIVDTLRNLLQLRDETDNSEVARVLNPWIAEARRRDTTLVMDHHMRKGSGLYGEGIAGGHALLGVFDIALELLRDRNHSRRRVLRPYARLISPPELAYELAVDGSLRALGEPSQFELQEVIGAIRSLRFLDYRETKAIREELGDPQPSPEQVRQALLSLARAGEIERDPPLSKSAAGKRCQWRFLTSPPTNNALVGG